MLKAPWRLFQGICFVSIQLKNHVHVLHLLSRARHWARLRGHVNLLVIVTVVRSWARSSGRDRTADGYFIILRRELGKTGAQSEFRTDFPEEKRPKPKGEKQTRPAGHQEVWHPRRGTNGSQESSMSQGQPCGTRCLHTLPEPKAGSRQWWLRGEQLVERVLCCWAWASLWRPGVTPCSKQGSWAPWWTWWKPWHPLQGNAGTHNILHIISGYT